MHKLLNIILKYIEKNVRVELKTPLFESSLNSQ